MSFPLPALTFYRMADVSPAGTAIGDLLDAMYTALSATTDYRGTSLASTHLWTWTKAGTPTATVYASPPSGTAMGLDPRIIFAGHTATTGTMASPDSWLTSGLHASIVKNPGAYNAWNNAAPFTSGSFFGYWRAAATAANATATKVRAFISEESVFLQIIQAATTQYWIYVGAVVSPHTNDTTLAGESDNRLYGMINSGSAGVGASFLTTTAGFLGHSTSIGDWHCGHFLPGSASLRVGGKVLIFGTAPSTNQRQEVSNAFINVPIVIATSGASNQSTGYHLGTVRGIAHTGIVQSGRYLRSGSTDLYHFVSIDTTADAHGIALKAAA